MVNFTRPKYVIPIHGEPMHLITMKRMLNGMAMLDNENVLMLEDGDKIKFHRGKFERRDKVPASKIYIDLRGHFSMDEESVRERKHLSRDGAVTVVMRKNADGTFDLPPVVETAGFKPEEKNITRLQEFLTEHMPEFINSEDYDNTEIKDGLKRLTKRYFKKTLDRRPLVIPVVTEK
jgi:ribonuclease J